MVWGGADKELRVTEFVGDVACVPASEIEVLQSSVSEAGIFGDSAGLLTKHV